MNKLQQILAVSLIITGTNSFAGISERAAPCPPISTITAVKFISAKTYIAGQWELLSNSFNHKNQDWNVIFGVKMPDVKSSEDALEKGQVYYSSKVSLTQPRTYFSNGSTFCVYVNKPRGDYSVIAINPPIKRDETTAARWVN
ncbi:MAG: hypothetical protein H0W64_07495 [Gammaproteobacteria bacterium]|nr:hypothetical protein [Gammaproteobacteria bacterium]